jgi:hypothetical protein
MRTAPPRKRTRGNCWSIQYRRHLSFVLNLTNAVGWSKSPPRHDPLSARAPIIAPVQWSEPSSFEEVAMHSRILAAKIATWLRQRGGDCFCDNCIASEMTEEDSKNVHRIATEVSRGTAPECHRFRAKCAACGDVTVVTMARRNLGVG